MSPPAGRDRRYVSVIGAGRCGPAEYEAARSVARELAGRGAVIVCGGLGGVMEAAARGAQEAGGDAIGVLPSHERSAANPYLTHVITTGMGEARNLAVISSGDVVIAVGGEYGTLSEIGLAAKVGRPVVLLDSWRLEPASGRADRLRYASSPAEAASLAEDILSSRET